MGPVYPLIALGLVSVLKATLAVTEPDRSELTIEYQNTKTDTEYEIRFLYRSELTEFGSTGFCT